MKIMTLVLLSFLILGAGNAYATSRYIETMGTGVADPKLNNPTQERATARDAAIIEAQYKMLPLISGLHPSGAATDENSLKSGIVQGAKVVKTEWTGPDQCRVTLRLDKKQFESLTGTTLQ